MSDTPESTGSDQHPHGPGSHRLLANEREMPPCYPIKGNVRDDGRRYYHRPDSRNYEATRPTVWFDSPSAAEAAGFVLSPSHPDDADGSAFEPGGSAHPCSAAEVETQRAAAAGSAEAGEGAAAGGGAPTADNGDDVRLGAPAFDAELHPYGIGSHAPLADTTEMPRFYPIKGEVRGDGTRHYHRPDSTDYRSTSPEAWFDSPSAAEAVGFDLAPTHPEESSGEDFEPGGSQHGWTLADVQGARLAAVRGPSTGRGRPAGMNGPGAIDDVDGAAATRRLGAGSAAAGGEGSADAHAIADAGDGDERLEMPTAGEADVTAAGAEDDDVAATDGDQVEHDRGEDDQHEDDQEHDDGATGAAAAVAGAAIAGGAAVGGALSGGGDVDPGDVDPADVDPADIDAAATEAGPGEPAEVFHSRRIDNFDLDADADGEEAATDDVDLDAIADGETLAIGQGDYDAYADGEDVAGDEELAEELAGGTVAGAAAVGGAALTEDDEETSDALAAGAVAGAAAVGGAALAGAGARAREAKELAAETAELAAGTTRKAAGATAADADRVAVAGRSAVGGGGEGSGFGRLLWWGLGVVVALVLLGLLLSQCGGDDDSEVGTDGSGAAADGEASDSDSGGDTEAGSETAATDRSDDGGGGDTEAGSDATAADGGDDDADAGDGDGSAASPTTTASSDDEGAGADGEGADGDGAADSESDGDGAGADGSDGSGSGEGAGAELQALAAAALSDAGFQNLSVEVDGDTIRLLGDVESEADAEAALAAVGSVDGMGEMTVESALVVATAQDDEETPAADPVDDDPSYTG